ncbi:MAG: dihydrofolate reductase family protein [Vicinamibacterales bacterium]
MGAAVRALLAFDVSSVLIEGGAVLHRALLDADLVDTVHLIVAPCRLGEAGVPVFGTGVLGLPGLEPGRVDTLGPDNWMEFDVHGNR